MQPHCNSSVTATSKIIIFKLSSPKVIFKDFGSFSDVRYLREMGTQAYEAVDTLSSLGSVLKA